VPAATDLFQRAGMVVEAVHDEDATVLVAGLP
jgi:hypothetical protein